MQSLCSSVQLTLLTFIVVIVSGQFEEDSIFSDDITQQYYCTSKACECKLKSIRDLTNIFIQCPHPNTPVGNTSIVRADFFEKLKFDSEVILRVKNNALNNVTSWNMENFLPAPEDLKLDVEIIDTNLVSVEANFFSKMNIVLAGKFSLIRNFKIKSIPSFFLSSRGEESKFRSVNIIRNGIESIDWKAFTGIFVQDTFTLHEPNAIIHQQAFEGAQIDGFLIINDARAFPSYLKSMSKLTGLILKNFDFNEFPADSLPSTLKYLHLLNKNGDEPLIIQPEAFRNLPQLTVLVMRNCNLEEIPKNLLLGSQFQLHELDLTSNRLRKINKEDLHYQNSLKTVHLSHNQIHNLSSLLDGIFRKSWFPALNFVNVSYNSLSQIKEPAIPEYDRLQEKALKVIIDKNPLRCDCTFKWMLQAWVANFINLSSAICTEPRAYKSLQSVLTNNALIACKSSKPADIKAPSIKKLQPDMASASNSESYLKIEVVVMVVIVTLVVIAAIVFVIYWKKRGHVYRYARPPKA